MPFDVHFSYIMFTLVVAIIIGACVGLVFAGCYAVMIEPMSHPDDWSKFVFKRGVVAPPTSW